MSIPLSILDLSPIVEGGDAAQSLANSADLAAHAERWGYRRYWVAEHHNLPGIASAATAVVIGHIAAATSTIRVGAGGVMLPNHAPLIIAEQFGTLASLHPGRIDLGLGRAPGTDQATARALRRTLAQSEDGFPNDVAELINYFRPADPSVHVRAVPGEGLDVPVWILGSSLYGAQLAAHFGLPYAFASHFAPQEMIRAPAIYRERFRPSAELAEPRVMLALNLFAADTDEEARRLMTSHQQAVINMRTGRPGRLPPPVDDYETRFDPALREMAASVLACSIVGSPQTVGRRLAEFMEDCGADELILTGQIHDHPARLRSFEIAAEAHARITAGSGLPATAD
jgi:luciferase family oxidoreductase group 1